MSKVNRSRLPVCPAIQTAPVTPPAGPDISIVTGESAATSAAASPPSLRRIDSSALQALLGQLARQVPHVPGHLRLHVAVRHRGESSFVFAHLGQHDAGTGDRDTGQFLRGDLGDALLVVAVGERVDQRDGQRLDPVALAASGAGGGSRPRRAG